MCNDKTTPLSSSVLMLLQVQAAEVGLLALVAGPAGEGIAGTSLERKEKHSYL